MRGAWNRSRQNFDRWIRGIGEPRQGGEPRGFAGGTGIEKPAGDDSGRNGWNLGARTGPRRDKLGSDFSTIRADCLIRTNVRSARSAAYNMLNRALIAALKRCTQPL